MSQVVHPENLNCQISRKCSIAHHKQKSLYSKFLNSFRICLMSKWTKFEKWVLRRLKHVGNFYDIFSYKYWHKWKDNSRSPAGMSVVKRIIFFEDFMTKSFVYSHVHRFRQLQVDRNMEEKYLQGKFYLGVKF